MKKSMGLVFAIFLMLVNSQNGFCSSSRANKKLGVIAGIGAPTPTVWSVGLGYNIIPMLQVSAGYGQTNLTILTATLSVSAIGGNLKILHPDWNFSPYAKVGVNSLTGTITGVSTGLPLGTLVNVGGGVDWLTDGGFNLGAEAMFHPAVSGAGVAIGLYLGWYFG